jgi:N-acylneuraminate cytidylyltransferase
VSGVVALIPARSGSKGVPNKNIRLLGGKPLLEWSIKACLKSKCIDRVIVSTDSFEYAELAKKLGAEAPFLRPAEISGDKSVDYDFVVHALDWLSNSQGEPDYIAHIRPTTPMRDPLIIDQAFDIFRTHKSATALRSVQKMSESAYKCFEISNLGQLKQAFTGVVSLDVANNARQGFVDTYTGNGYIDFLATKHIRSEKLLHGNFVIPYVTSSVIEVDTEDDFLHLEYQLSNNQEIFQKLFN